MPILRLSLSGALILSLLLPGLAVAQDDETTADGQPVVVSGTLDCQGEVAASPAPGASPAVAGETQVVNLHQWTASDPRLEGEAAYSGHWQLYDPPAEDTGSTDVDTAIYAIVNDGGSWICKETRTPQPPRTGGERQTLVFSGQGDYEGLTAYLEVDLSQAPYAFSGIILTGDEPPYAEPQG
jgi:hypothetical protein